MKYKQPKYIIINTLDNIRPYCCEELNSYSAYLNHAAKFYNYLDVALAYMFKNKHLIKPYDEDIHLKIIDFKKAIRKEKLKKLNEKRR